MTMAKQRIEPGDRLTIGVEVTAVWPDGKITVSKGEKPPLQRALFDKQD
jgi:hypothetical protein